jgi:hypothetical protein
MAWEAILSTDPRFEMDFEIDDIDLDDDESQDPNGIFDRNHRLGLLRVLLHMQNVLPDHCIQFYNKEDRRRRQVMLDQPIKPLSTVDSTDPNNIIDLIKYVPEGEVVISHQAVFVKDEKGADFNELLCSFAISGTMRGKSSSPPRLTGIRWGTYAIYFDKPLPECYTWARNFENTIRSVVSNVQFQNRIGICNDCTNMLRQEEHAIRDIVGWGIFLCDECYIQRKIQRKREEDLKKEAAKQKREARKKGSPTFSPNQIILPSKNLGRALYQLYEGKCQYC